MNRGSQALEIPKEKRDLKQKTFESSHEITCNQFHARFPLSAISGFVSAVSVLFFTETQTKICTAIKLCSLAKATGNIYFRN